MESRSFTNKILIILICLGVLGQRSSLQKVRGNAMKESDLNVFARASKGARVPSKALFFTNGTFIGVPKMAFFLPNTFHRVPLY